MPSETMILWGLYGHGGYEMVASFHEGADTVMSMIHKILHSSFM